MEGLLDYLNDEIKDIDETWQSIGASQNNDTASDGIGLWSNPDSNHSSLGSTLSFQRGKFTIRRPDRSHDSKVVYPRHYNANPPSESGSSILNGHNSSCSWYSTDTEPLETKTFAQLYAAAVEPHGHSRRTDRIHFWQKDAAIAEWICELPVDCENMSLGQQVWSILRMPAPLDSEMSGLDEYKAVRSASRISDFPRAAMPNPAVSQSRRSSSKDYETENCTTSLRTTFRSNAGLLEYQTLVSTPWEDPAFEKVGLGANVNQVGFDGTIDLGELEASRFILPQDQLARLKGQTATWPKIPNADGQLKRHDSTANKLIRRVTVNLGIRGKKKRLINLDTDSISEKGCETDDGS